MTVSVDPMDFVPRQPEILSPELALVDPELGRVARALLADVLEAPLVRPAGSAPIGAPFFGRPSRRSPVRAGPHHSRRLLVGVAAATMVALLLFDVRVDVRERPAAADSSTLAPSVGSAAADPSVPVAAPQPRRSSARKPFHFTDRRFAWSPVSGASGYHVEFFRGSTRVFANDTTSPLVTVPAKWSLDGGKHSLRPGVYRWYVWPIVEGRRQPHAVVQASVSIP
jgi:hypothetical protein